MRGGRSGRLGSALWAGLRWTGVASDIRMIPPLGVIVNLTLSILISAPPHHRLQRGLPQDRAALVADGRFCARFRHPDAPAEATAIRQGRDRSGIASSVPARGSAPLIPEMPLCPSAFLSMGTRPARRVGCGGTDCRRRGSPSRPRPDRRVDAAPNRPRTPVVGTDQTEQIDVQRVVALGVHRLVDGGDGRNCADEQEEATETAKRSDRPVEPSQRSPASGAQGQEGEDRNARSQPAIP